MLSKTNNNVNNSSKKMSDMRVLFLGNCADPNMKEPIDSSLVARRRYHMEIYSLLSKLFVNVIGSSNPEDLFNYRGEYDYVFSLYNQVYSDKSFHASEVLTSTICEYLKVPYLGARPETRAIAQNKSLFKTFVNSINIPSPNSIAIGNSKKIENTKNLHPPFFVKPQSCANSAWIRSQSYCVNWDEVEEETSFLLSNKQEVLIEEFIQGINLTVPVLGGEKPKVLALVESPSSENNNILTSSVKVQDKCDLAFNVVNSDEMLKRAQTDAELIYDTLGPIDYFRMDYRFNPETEDSKMLEINICCDISSFGSFAYAANQKGISHEELVKTILQISMARQ